MLPVAIGLAVASRRGWTRAACIALALLALTATLLTFSRGAAVALLVLPFVYRPVRRAWPLMLAAGVAVVLFAPGIWEHRLAGIGNTSNPEIATRLDLWSSAEQTFADHPVLGTGLDSFHQAYLAQERPGRTYLGVGAPIQAPDTAHNLYLNTLAEQGIVGAAALALLAFAFARLISRLRRAEQARTRAIGLALLGTGVVVFVHNLFDVTLIPKTSILLWALFGVGAAAFELDRGEGRE
jgi:O-antigen ligase